ncbi:MAG: YqgE/AlgH family protein [Rhodospirillales bacterium]|nr:YqgE/AlgH family protein [Rhodospirillales bacterium]
MALANSLTKRSRYRAAAVLALLSAVLLAAPPVPAAEETLAGKLLIASPELTGPNFARTVIYMIRHDAHGAFGLVVNEPMGELPIEALLGGPKAAGQPPTTVKSEAAILVHYGGPVEPRRPFLLHSPDIMPDGSVALDDTIAFSRSPTDLKSLTSGERPAQLLVILGYAGWAPGQLEGEIEGGGWYVGPGDTALVFDPDPATAWDRAVARYGPEL